MPCFYSKDLVLSVLSVNVNVADCTLKNSDSCAIVTGLDHNGLFLDADDLADNSANRLLNNFVKTTTSTPA